MSVQLTEVGQKEIQMIVFSLGAEEYAVPITQVQEIIMPQKPTRIPKSSSFVEGVINLRGHIIPVIDGRKKFNLLSIDENVNVENTERTRIMLLEMGDETVGLIVDEVSEVIHLNTGNIEPPPANISIETDYLHGVGKYKEKLLILLKLENFLSVSEKTELTDLNAKK